MARPPDWLIYGGMIALAAVATLALRGQASAPPAPSMPGEDELGAFLGPVTPFDPDVVVEAPEGGAAPVSGTAFALSGEGAWLTARHVVEGCRQVVLAVGGGQAVSADVRLGQRADVALLITEGGPEALATRPPESELRVGQIAYHPGYPQARPGEIASRLIGRERLRSGRRGERSEPVLAWAEIGRTEGLEGALSGLSGAPALDRRGRVVAVTIAEAPRRGRIYTTAPESLEPLAAEAARPGSAATSGLITPENYGRVSDALRRDLRVAQVVCLSRAL